MSSTPLIDQLRSEGAWDSRGKFHLDLLRRSHQIFQLQIQQPHLYLLKIIQAAVAAGTGQIQLDWTASQIRLTCPLRDIQCDALKGFFGEETSAPSGWLDHLTQGIMLATLAPGRGFQLKLWDGRQGCEISPDGISWLESSRPAGLQLEFRRAASEWWHFRARHQADRQLWQTLQQRLQFCPAPIVVNQRMLNAGDLDLFPWFKVRPEAQRDALEKMVCSNDTWLLHSLEFGQGFAFRSLCNHYRLHQPSCVALIKHSRNPDSQVAILHSPGDIVPVEAVDTERLRQIAGTDRDLILNFSDPSFGSQRTTYNVQLLRATSRFQLTDLRDETGFPVPLCPVSLSTLLALSIVPQSQSLFAGVQDGLLLDPLPLPNGPPGGLAIVHAPHWKTDLSLLQPVVDAELRAEQDSYAKALNKLLAEARGWLQDPELKRNLDLPDSVAPAWQAAP